MKINEHFRRENKTYFGLINENEDIELKNSSNENLKDMLTLRKNKMKKAILNVQKTLKTHIDTDKVYQKGELLFHHASKQFCRVLESQVGFLKIQTISGSDIIIGKRNTNKKIEKRKVKILTKLISEKEKTQEQENNLSTNIDEGSALIKNKSTKINSVAKGKREKIKNSTKRSTMTPNRLIKQDYQQMSNKELGKVLSLSEHTIRRKLNEWKLKRRKSQKTNNVVTSKPNEGDNK